MVHCIARGDKRLRSSYGAAMLRLLSDQQISPDSLRQVVDLGCSTGLSSLALLDLLPGAAVVGVDLSPHFLSVGKHLQQKRQVRIRVLQV
jgi:trans-aconitate methyltransferase